MSFGLRAVGDVHHHEPAVAPRAVSGIAVDDRMMQAEAAVRAPARRLARLRVHAGQPVAPRFLRLRGIGHVDGHEDVVGEAVEHRRDIGPAAAGVPDAVNAAALDRHEADLARLRRIRDVVDGKASGPVALACRRSLGFARLIAVRADVILALVLKFRRSEHVARIDHQQEIAVGLEMDGPGVVWRRHVLDRLGCARIAHVDHAEALGEHVADKGVALVDHHLHAVLSPALVGVADQLHVSDEIRLRQILAAHACRSRDCAA